MDNEILLPTDKLPKNIKPMKALQGQFKGEILIIGSGPSYQKLKMLNTDSIIKIGCNWSSHKFSCELTASQDKQFILNSRYIYRETMNLFYLPNCFHTLKDNPKCKELKGFYSYKLHTDNYAKPDNLDKLYTKSQFTGILAILTAILMGFETIYTIGFDAKDSYLYGQESEFNKNNNKFVLSQLPIYKEYMTNLCKDYNIINFGHSDWGNKKEINQTMLNTNNSNLINKIMEIYNAFQR